MLDKALPDGSGIELCGSFHNLYPATPILMYSAHAYPHDREEAFGVGAAAYVDKPDVAGLLAGVARLLGEARHD
jgi:CheY-like chemotaxis protein